MNIAEWLILFHLCGKAAKWMESQPQPLRYDQFGMPLCVSEIAFEYGMEQELNAFTSRCYNDFQPL